MTITPIDLKEFNDDDDFEGTRQNTAHGDWMVITAKSFVPGRTPTMYGQHFYHTEEDAWAGYRKEIRWLIDHRDGDGVVVLSNAADEIVEAYDEDMLSREEYLLVCDGEL